MFEGFGDLMAEERGEQERASLRAFTLNEGGKGGRRTLVPGSRKKRTSECTVLVLSELSLLASNAWLMAVRRCNREVTCSVLR